MKQNWKGIVFGILITLIILAIMVSIAIATDKLVGYLWFIGFFIGGLVAVYVAKSETIKETMVAGCLVGLISGILYMIIMVVLIPLLEQIYTYLTIGSLNNLPAPQAFLMKGIVKGYEPTIIDYLRSTWIVFLGVLEVTTLSLIGGLSHYFVSSYKKGETLKTNVLLGYLAIIVLLIGLILSPSFYLLTVIGVILIISIIIFYLLIVKESYS